jgi:hypothetical protein
MQAIQGYCRLLEVSYLALDPKTSIKCLTCSGTFQLPFSFKWSLEFETPYIQKLSPAKNSEFSNIRAFPFRSKAR